MNKFSTTLGGSKEARRGIAEYARRVGFSMEEAVEVVGEAVQAQAKELILTSPATGHVYYRDNPPRIHRASAPGEPPADDTGRLHASIKLRMVKINQYASAAVVGSSLPYALELERFGPEGNGETRPFLRPAVLLVERRVGSILASAWDKHKL